MHRRFWEEPDLALRMWLTHNNALLAFARTYPEDTLAVSLDMIRDGFPSSGLSTDVGTWTEDVPVGEVFDPAIASGRSGQQPVSDYGAGWQGRRDLAGARRAGRTDGEDARAEGGGGCRRVISIRRPTLTF